MILVQVFVPHFFLLYFADLVAADELKVRCEECLSEGVSLLIQPTLKINCNYSFYTTFTFGAMVSYSIYTQVAYLHVTT